MYLKHKKIEFYFNKKKFQIFEYFKWKFLMFLEKYENYANKNYFKLMKFIYS